MQVIATVPFLFFYEEGLQRFTLVSGWVCVVMTVCAWI